MNEEDDNADGNGNGPNNNDVEERNDQLWVKLSILLLGVSGIVVAVTILDEMEMDNQPVHVPNWGEDNNNDHNQPTLIPLRNTSNSTKYFKNPEDSFENTISRNLVIRKKIKEMKPVVDTQGVPTSDAEIIKEQQLVDQIVKSFVETDEFENFVIDTEINDAIKKLRRDKGYRRRDNTIFRDIFQQIETHFLGDDPQEVRLIRKVAETLETLARQKINERNKLQRNEKDNEEIIAHEILNEYENDVADDGP